MVYEDFEILFGKKDDRNMGSHIYMCTNFMLYIIHIIFIETMIVMIIMGFKVWQPKSDKQACFILQLI